MFRRLPNARGVIVRVIIDGQPRDVYEGETVAAAMIALGVNVCRTTSVSGSPRASYCMMGVCFDCLVTIDGIGNRQGCLTQVRDGMTIAAQHGKRELGL